MDKGTLFLIALALVDTACLPNKAYRTKVPLESGITCPPGSDDIASKCSVQMVESTLNGVPRSVPIAFVEFDDVGQSFIRGQLEAAEKVIKHEQPEHGDVVTILFIHGWKNNASDDSGNVAGFRRFMQEFQMRVTNRKLVGVYLGWRGGVTNAAVIKEFTYWNRRNTATYIPGSNMSEALLRIAQATKGPDYCNESSLIMVGHSFGGLVLERTVTQYLTRRVVERTPGCPAKLDERIKNHPEQAKDIPSLADLIVFVNEAAAATEAIQLLTTFYYEVDTKQPQFPAIISITSQGDTATRFILPVGQGANLLFFRKSLRSYGGNNDPDPFGIAQQKTYYLRSAAHIPELQSHIVAPDDPQHVIKTAYQDRGYTCLSLAGPNDTKKDYYVVRIKDAKNRTPYWVMEMPTEIVPDHSHIFRQEFGQLLQAFVLRQADGNPGARTDPCYDLSGPTGIVMGRMNSTITLK